MIVPGVSGTADFALAAPKSAPTMPRRLPSKRTKYTPVRPASVVKAPAPFRAAPPLSRSTNPAGIALSIFGNKPIKARRDVHKLFV